MKFQMRWVFFIVISAFAAACSSSPVEVKEVDSSQEEGASAAQEIFNTKGNNASSAAESESQWVECEVFETLETDRYSYLHVVQNGGDTAWVATRKADFVKGGVYRYRNGLLKTTITVLNSTEPSTESCWCPKFKGEGCHLGLGNRRAHQPKAPRQPKAPQWRAPCPLPMWWKTQARSLEKMSKFRAKW